MDLTQALQWAAQRKNAVLITIRGDGRAQSSDISYTVNDATFAISVTESRAKTANMRRDPRVVLHVTDPSSWSYVSFDGEAELTEAAKSVDDETADALVAYYEAVAGKPHENWQEYREAMVEEGRLLIHLKPKRAVGQIN